MSLVLFVLVLASIFPAAFAASLEAYEEGYVQDDAAIPAQTLTAVSVLQNGDFEKGLEGWLIFEKFQGPAGHGNPSISRSTTHSGSSAVALNLISSVPGGFSGVAPPETIGIYQNVVVPELRGLRVEAWFMMRQMSLLMAARLRVQVNDLVIKYYVSYDTEQHIRNLDILDPVPSRPIFLYHVTPRSPEWGEWLSINRDVAADFQSEFGSQGTEIFQRDQADVTLALEFVNYGPTPDYQVMLWDDVQATAMVPAQQTTTTIETTTVQPTQTSSRPATTSVSSMTTTTETGTKLGGLYSLTDTLYIGLLAAVPIALALIAFLVIRGRRKTSQATICPRCGTPSPMSDLYCERCGTRLR